MKNVYFYFLKNGKFMNSFIGDYNCRLDSKGRVLFPSAFKKQMGPMDEYRFVIKKDVFENCLVIYTMDEWNRQNKIIRAKINPYKRDHNRFLRNFYRDTAELVLDSAGRFLIPKKLIDELGLENDLILAGQNTKIEVWDKQAYEQLAESHDDFAGLAEDIFGDVELQAE